jgi:hypothetical protein
MTIIRVRTGVVVLHLDFGGCSGAALHRRRAITARAAIGVHGAIASNVTNIRAVVRGRLTANAGRVRPTIRVGEALVVRTSAGADQAFKGEAAAVHSVRALRVGGAAGSDPRRVGLACANRGDARRSGTSLRRATRRRGPVVERNLRIAHRRCSRFDQNGLAARRLQSGVSRVGTGNARFGSAGPSAAERARDGDYNDETSELHGGRLRRRRARGEGGRLLRYRAPVGPANTDAEDLLRAIAAELGWAGRWRSSLGRTRVQSILKASNRRAAR